MAPTAAADIGADVLADVVTDDLADDRADDAAAAVFAALPCVERKELTGNDAVGRSISVRAVEGS